MIGEMIADHDRDCQSRDFQNMIVSDRRSWFGKMIVSDRRSRKKVSCLTLTTGFGPTQPYQKVLCIIQQFVSLLIRIFSSNPIVIPNVPFPYVLYVYLYSKCFHIKVNQPQPFLRIPSLHARVHFHLHISKQNDHLQPCQFLVADLPIVHHCETEMAKNLHIQTCYKVVRILYLYLCKGCEK